jgi:hypothetical protein
MLTREEIDNWDKMEDDEITVTEVLTFGLVICLLFEVFIKLWGTLWIIF